MPARPPLTPRETKKPDDSQRQMIRWLAQNDLYYLVDSVLNYDNPESRISPTLHKPLAEFAQTTPHRENMYLVSRGFLKTEFITVGRNIQRILKNPESRNLIGSNKAENAEGMLTTIKGHLVKPVMLWLFPDILVKEPERNAEKWTASAITVKRKRRRREATIETTGATGENTGRHYDHGTFDDLVGKENYSTRDLREATKQFIREIQPLFDPGSTKDYVGTPWHYDDAYAWKLAQRKAGIQQFGLFMRACWVPDPAGEDAPPYGRVRVLYPEKFTVKELLKIRADMGPSDFAAQYLMNPLPADTVYFPRQKIAKNIVSRRECPPLDELWIVMAVDPAISENKWADYSAIAVAGFDAEGRQWLLDLRRGRWPESELVAQVYDAHERVGRRTIACGFETIGFAKIYRRLFTQEGERRNYYLNVQPLERDTKKTKNTRIRALEPGWSAATIMLFDDLPALEDFLEEAERWRPDRENAHDDLLDAVVDTLQMRARPDAKTPESAYDDPELQARVAWEVATQAERLRRRAPEYDRMELRQMWTMQRRRQAWNEEREATMAGSAVGEFFS